MHTGHLGRPSSLAILLLAALSLGGARTDGTVGARQSFTGRFTVPATAGQQRGGNLFHSFATFSVGKRESATFTASAGVTDIVVRVTGGDPTVLNGGLRCDVPGCALFLVNPAGVT